MLEKFVGLAVLYILKHLLPDKGKGTEPAFVILPFLEHEHSDGPMFDPSFDSEDSPGQADKDLDDEWIDN